MQIMGEVEMMPINLGMIHIYKAGEYLVKENKWWTIRIYVFKLTKNFVGIDIDIGKKQTYYQIWFDF